MPGVFQGELILALGGIFQLLSQKLYLISDTTFLLNLARDAVHSVDDGGVRPIESSTYGLQSLISVLTAKIHAKIAWIDHVLLARV